MAASMSVSRGCNLLNSFLYKNVAWRKVNVKGYARIFHRNPIKVLSAEEAKNLIKRSAIYEEPEILTGKNNHKHNHTREHVGEFLRKTENSDASVSVENTKFRPERDFSIKNKKLSKATSNLHAGEVLKESDKHETKGSEKLLSHSSPAVCKTFMHSCGGEKVELKIIFDKKTAERKLSALVQNAKSSKARQVSGKILLEGERLIADALKAGAHADAIFFSNSQLLDTFPLKQHPSVELYQVKYEKIQLWSDVTTSPGVLGIFDIAKPIKLNSLKQTQNIPLTIICDNVRDPGNMGSVIRCAAAVGCRMLITTSECVDVWDSKVLRAAAGAHFRLELVSNVEWDQIPENFVTQGTTVILADSFKKEIYSSDQSITASREDKAKNWRRAQQEGESCSKPTETVEVTAKGNIQKRDSSYLDKNTLKKYRDLPLSYFSYDNLQLTNTTKSVALVIGGEAHGLSSAAHLLAHNFSGSKVFIPLENEVESLNAGVAVGILAYEIRRLLLQKAPNSENSIEVTVAT